MCLTYTLKKKDKILAFVVEKRDGNKRNHIEYRLKKTEDRLK